MELKSKEGFFDRSGTLLLGDTEVHYRHTLPRKARDWMALDMAEAGLVFDEELGVVYEGYTVGLVTDICMVKYYTDLDLSAYEGEEGWYALHDILTSHGFLDALTEQISDDLYEVYRVYIQIKEAAEKTFERRHSLDHRFAKSFGFLLTDEDATQSLAKAESVNNRMIEMLEAFQQRQSSQSVADGINLLKFNKREPDKW